MLDNLIVIEMKSSITNCKSNDQLLQLVPIQLLQKATSHHPKWQQLLVLVAVQFLSGNFCIWQQSWRTERHQGFKGAAHRAVQPTPEATWAGTWQSYNFQSSSSGYCCRELATEACCQPPSVLLSHWWHRMLFLLQHHSLTGFRRKTFFQFVVCWLKTLVIVWKNRCTWERS